MSDEIETLWRFGQFHAEPVEYRVVRRTGKTLKARQVSLPHHTVPSTYEHTVRLSQVGVEEWFCSPRDAWAREAQRHERQIKWTQEKLQRERTRLGQIQSILRRLDVDGGHGKPSEAVPPSKPKSSEKDELPVVGHTQTGSR